MDDTFLASGVRSFLRLYVLFLLIECAIRYLIEPTCFLNYSCRFEAKTVGYHSTTNALGTSLIVILSSLIYHHVYRYTRIMLATVLVTSMARAAIISQFFGVALIKLVNSQFLVKMLSFVAVSVVITFVYLVDPLGVSADGSLLSKFAFFGSAHERLNTASADQLLIGFGANFEQVANVVGVNGWSPHAPF